MVVWDYRHVPLCRWGRGLAPGVCREGGIMDMYELVGGTGPWGSCTLPPEPLPIGSLGEMGAIMCLGKTWPCNSPAGNWGRIMGGGHHGRVSDYVVYGNRLSRQAIAAAAETGNSRIEK